MIVDPSAIVAIAFDEPKRDALVRALLAAPNVRLATPTWVEVSIVLERSGMAAGQPFLKGFEREFRVELVEFTSEHATAAFDAWRQFGKGNHAARLNYGDCMSYATAKLAGESLLFVGDDFAQTDIEPALN